MNFPGPALPSKPTASESHAAQISPSWCTWQCTSMTWVYVRDRWGIQLVRWSAGKPAVRETCTMPQWAGSCWYYLRFIDPTNSQAMLGKEAEQYWMPVDLYVGGAEHAVLHLLYARFWHKVCFTSTNTWPALELKTCVKLHKRLGNTMFSKYMPSLRDALIAPTTGITAFITSAALFVSRIESSVNSTRVHSSIWWQNQLAVRSCDQPCCCRCCMTWAWSAPRSPSRSWSAKA